MKVVEELKELKRARLAMTRSFISLASCNMRSPESVIGGSISANPSLVTSALQLTSVEENPKMLMGGGADLANTASRRCSTAVET